MIYDLNTRLLKVHYSNVSGIQIPTTFCVTKRNLPLTFENPASKVLFFNNGL